MRIRSFGFVLVTMVLVLAAACGGSDEKGGGVLSGGNSWDTARADDLTHAALLTAGDLGGSGWKATDDKFDDEPLAGACSDFDAFKKDANAAAVSKAKRELEKQGASANDIGMQVESTVAVYKDAKTASDLISRYRGVLGNDKFITCFQDQLKNETSKDAKVTIKKSDPSGVAPNGGTNTALDVEIVLGRDSLTVRTENYTWTMGNSTIQVSVTAGKSSFTADIVKTALTKQEQAANDALKGTRQRSVSAPATATPARVTPTLVSTATARTTPASGAALSKVTSLGDTNSHKYVVKLDSSGIDFLGMQDLVNSLATVTGTPARPGGPIALEFVGAYSKPDKGQVKMTVNGTVITQTTVGMQQWTQFNGKTEGPKNVGRQSVDDLSVVVSMLSGITSDDALLKYLKCPSTDNVNGVQARVCGFTQSDLSRGELQEFVDGFLQESNANVKIDAKDVTKATFQLAVASQGNYPVRFFFEFAGKDSRARDFNLRMEANVTDINKTVDIVAPR